MRAGTVALFAGLASSGFMSPLIALAVLVGYLLVCAESFLGTHATGVFQLSTWGFGPTELRIVFAAERQTTALYRAEPRPGKMTPETL